MEIIRYTKHNTKEVIDKTISILKKGGIVVFPTETTYGLGADPLNPDAVAKLYAYKEKREGKPFSIAVADQQMAEKYAVLNEVALNLYTNFLPGPITVVSEGKHVLAPGVESETGTIGIRIPQYDLILQLLQTYNNPITATSANASYKKRPYAIEDILDTISQRQKDLIDLIIDAGELPHNDPSTVVDTTLNTISVLRQGDVVLTDFEEYQSASVDETKKLAHILMDRYKEKIHEKPIIFALQGDMGAGKTHFTKGIAEFLGITQTVSSPSFTLEEEYPFTFDTRDNYLAHIDTWRMFSKEEFEELHIDKRLEAHNLIVIEWAEKVYSFLQEYHQKADIIWIKFGVLDDTHRQILFSDTFIK